jgi:hypothetical protein
MVAFLENENINSGTRNRLINAEHRVLHSHTVPELREKEGTISPPGIRDEPLLEEAGIVNTNFSSLLLYFFVVYSYYK